MSFSDIFKFDAVFGEESSVSNEDFFIYAMTQRQKVKKLLEKIINFLIVFCLDFSIKAIEFVKIACFVISS
jgi:hypothetical protein